MKNVKLVFTLLVSVFFIIPICVHAEAFLTNMNGIEISEEEYNNFLKVRTHEYIMTMNEEKYEKLKSLDYDNVLTETKYIETTYNPHLMLSTEKEVSEEDFELSPLLDTDTSYFETTTKKLTLSLIGGTTWNYVVLTNTWKGTTKVRSFDVIGLRGNGVRFRNGSQIGEQIYSKSGKFTTIDYAWDGTNIKKLDNGFGISMNVINDTDIDSLQMSIECDVTPTENYSYIFGAYEHAVTNVSLADSQNYTMGGSGLGDVFIYPLSISQKYDGMSGVRLEYY